jgi:hypothetical protein
LPFPPPDPQAGAQGISFVGPDPQDNITFVGFEAGLGGNQAVSGAPYCAQITSEFTQTLQDGNKIDRKNVTNVCRDGQGRTRTEQTLPKIGQYSASNGAPQVIFINDPVSGVNYVLDPAHKTARKMVRPNAQGGPGRGPGGPGRGPAGPGGNPPQNNGGTNGPQRGRNNNSSSQSLGQMNIEGILVNGTLVTRTIPAGQVGNQSPIQVTSERWYSPDLKVNLLVKNNDPMRGQNTTTVSNINRNEPDPSLFQVPSDYTIQDMSRGRGGRGGPRPSPPAPQQ